MNRDNISALVMAMTVVASVIVGLQYILTILFLIRLGQGLG
jgi:predicted secreted protein